MPVSCLLRFTGHGSSDGAHHPIQQWNLQHAAYTIYFQRYFIGTKQFFSL